jgi:hypothetical protein
MTRKLAALAVCVLFVLASGCAQLKEMQMKRLAEQAAHEATLEEAIMLLGHMQAELIEGVEEAFAYVILKDIGEKEDHYRMMRSFDKNAGIFQQVVDLDAPEHKGLKKPFEGILAAKVDLEKAAFGMFDPVENGRKLCTSQKLKFERAVDRITRRLDRFMAKFVKKHYDEGLIEDRDTVAAVRLSMMHSDFLEGVEEVFGFLLLKQADERDDFYKKMEDFDTKAAQFQELEYIGRRGTGDISAAFAKMMQAKANCQAQAQELVTKFGKTWKYSTDDIVAFEETIDAFTEAYDNMMMEFDYLELIYRGRE